jgi:hypothetical protein
VGLMIPEVERFTTKSIAASQIEPKKRQPLKG